MLALTHCRIVSGPSPLRSLNMNLYQPIVDKLFCDRKVPITYTVANLVFVQPIGLWQITLPKATASAVPRCDFGASP